MTELRALLGGETTNLCVIEEYLDSLEHQDRMNAIRSLGRSHQARLFEAADGHRAVTLDNIVHADRPAMKEVVHHGKNSLPAFSHFAKVFVRPDDTSISELWGYNRAGRFVESVVGPGYFVAYAHGTEEVLVDYLRVPPRRPEHWPPILPNSARLSKVVYNGTKDVLRGVSRHVTIGRATRDGNPMSAWFVLCREDPR